MSESDDGSARVDYGAVYFRQLVSAAALHQHTEAGTFRATAVFDSGPYAGVAFWPLDADHVTRSRMRTPEEIRRSLGAAAASSPECPPGSVCDYVMHIVSGSSMSMTRPAEFIAFLHLDVAPAPWGSFPEQVLGVRAREGVELVAAHMYGMAGFNVAVEVVAPEARAMHDAVADVLRLDGVRTFQTMTTTAHLTQGFGGVQRPG